MWLLVNLGPSTSSRKKGRSTGDVVVAPKKGGKSTCGEWAIASHGRGTRPFQVLYISKR